MLNWNVIFGILNLCSRRFTLLEVLIAAAISVVVLAVVSGAAWSTLQTVSAAGRSADISLENAALVRRLALDLRGSRLQVYRPVAELELLQADEEVSPAFHAERSGDDMMLEFFTASAVTGPHMPAGFYRVSYRFDSRSGVLARRQAHIAQVEYDALPWQVIADELDSVDITFFDGEEWEEQWDSNEEGALPLSIKVSVAGRDGGAKRSVEFIVSPVIRR